MAQINKIIRCVFNSDLRCSHEGLSLVAKSLKIDLSELQPGEVIVFINGKKTALKFFGFMNTICHYKNKDGSRLDMRVLALIPKFFNGKVFQYDEALRTVFIEGGLK